MGNKPSQAWPPSWVKVKHDMIPEQKGQQIASDFHAYLQNSDRLPKIFRAFVDRTSLQNWSPEGLFKILGDASVEVYVSTSGNFPGGHGSIYDGKERKKVSMKAKEALERLQHVGNHQPVLAADERYYIYQYDSKPFSPLIDQISNSPSTLIPVPEVFSNVWISSADSLTPAHYDKADNLLLQLHGRKSFLIWDPAQLAYLSLQPETAEQDRQTTINMRDKHSVEAHPNFHNASAYYCELNPGDVLYMPEGWIHAVYSLDASASVNFWWNQPIPTPMDFTFTLDEDTYGVRRPDIAAIPVPPGVVLAKRFDTRENELSFFREPNAPIIPCQACSNKTHEYKECPYLGHYKYQRVCGQSCDYTYYTLLETAPVPEPVLTLTANFTLDMDTDRVRRPNIAAIPVPPGVVLAKRFNTRENDRRFFREPNAPIIPCQACSNKTHEYKECPYLGHYEYQRVSGQSCDYSDYKLIETAVKME